MHSRQLFLCRHVDEVDMAQVNPDRAVALIAFGGVPARVEFWDEYRGEPPLELQHDSAFGLLFSDSEHERVWFVETNVCGSFIERAMCVPDPPALSQRR